MKSLGDYTKRTWKTDGTINEQLMNAGISLCEEAGEVAGVLKKHIFHGHELDEDKLINELGDVFYYLCTIARLIDLNVENIASYNELKLFKRYPEGYSDKASIERVDTNGQG